MKLFWDTVCINPVKAAQRTSSCIGCQVMTSVLDSQSYRSSLQPWVSGHSLLEEANTPHYSPFSHPAGFILLHFLLGPAGGWVCDPSVRIWQRIWLYFSWLTIRGQAWTRRGENHSFCYHGCFPGKESRD